MVSLKNIQKDIKKKVSDRKFEFSHTTSYIFDDLQVN